MMPVQARRSQHPCKNVSSGSTRLEYQLLGVWRKGKSLAKTVSQVQRSHIKLKENKPVLTSVHLDMFT